MLEAIRDELIGIFRNDQFLLRTSLAEFERCAGTHAIRLGEIIKELSGWPSAELVGKDGELAVWLIAQHAPDINFQQECLTLLTKLPKTKERNQHIAYLTDRILVKQGSSQQYGTQFLS